MKYDEVLNFPKFFIRAFKQPTMLDIVKEEEFIFISVVVDQYQIEKFLYLNLTKFNMDMLVEESSYQKMELSFCFKLIEDDGDDYLLANIYVNVLLDKEAIVDIHNAIIQEDVK